MVTARGPLQRRRLPVDQGCQPSLRLLVSARTARYQIPGLHRPTQLCMVICALLNHLRRQRPSVLHQLQQGAPCLIRLRIPPYLLHRRLLPPLDICRHQAPCPALLLHPQVPLSRQIRPRIRVRPAQRLGQWRARVRRQSPLSRSWDCSLP